MRALTLLGTTFLLLFGVLVYAQDTAPQPAPGAGDDSAAAAGPVIGLYRAVYDKDIKRLMSFIDFNELVLNGSYLGEQYRDASPTRRHDFREAVVTGLAVGSINKNQFLLVKNSVRVRFDLTDHDYATVVFYNPASRMTVAKVRKVSQGETSEWKLYSLTAGR